MEIGPKYDHVVGIDLEIWTILYFPSEEVCKIGFYHEEFLFPTQMTREDLLST